MVRPVRLVAAAGMVIACGTAAAEIVINEIMYNTPGSPDVEYVELYNAGPSPRSVTGWYLLDDDDGHAPCLLSGTIAAEAYLVVPGSVADFSVAYPGVGPVNPTGCAAGPDGFSFGNTADEVRLFDATGAPADGVAYTDTEPWPAEPDGNGPSLELVNPLLDNALASSWGASLDAVPQGTPGAQNSIFLPDAPPLIAGVARDVPLPGPSDSVTVTAMVTDEATSILVELYVDHGPGFDASLMLDDGNSGDGAANDGLFGATIVPRPDGTLVRYYVAATDVVSQTTTEPPAAPEAYHAYTVGHQHPPLRINEIVASNQNGIFDGLGERDDWLEIRNPGPDPVPLGGMFLTDDLGNPTMFELPVTTLPPGASLLVWCDNETFQGPVHANFRLARASGEVGLFESIDHGNGLVDGYTYGPQSPDIALGYLPDDGDWPEYTVTPTPQQSNDGAPPVSPVCINELLTASNIPGLPDWVELHNRSAVAVDISGWHLSDDVTLPEKYGFPAGTVLPPGGFLSVDENELGFGFSADGSEIVMLIGLDGQTGMDYFDYGPQLPDVSQGRFPDGSSSWHFFGSPTMNLPNSCELGIPPLEPVAGVRFDSTTTLVWDALEDADVYDTVRGDLGLLRAGGGDFSEAMSGCTYNNGHATRAWAPERPGTATPIYYLVRGSTLACGFGSYESGGSSQAGTRDPGIEVAAETCP